MEEYYLTLLRHDYPQLPIASFAFLGGGEDHLAFVVNDDWIFRFARDAAGSRETTRDEATLLTFLQDRLPLPVPLPVYRNEERGYIGYQQLSGVPLLGLREQFGLRTWSTFPEAIGTFLTAVHATPLDLVRDFVHTDPVALADWLAEAQTTFAEVQGAIPPPLWPRIEAFLSEPAPDETYAPSLVHNDLGIEHILINPASRQVTGVIDWGDVAIADPAYDFGKLYRDLDLATLDATLAHYRSATNDLDAIRQRAIFYGRCTVFEDLAYGLQAGHEAYLQKSLMLLSQLFD